MTASPQIDHRLVRRACPVCNRADSTLERKLRDHQTSELFDLERCSHCSALFINPVPTVEDIGSYYEDFGGEMMHSGGHAIFDRLRRFAILRELRPLLSRLQENTLIADVGTGDGQVAKILADQGRRVLACDTYAADRWHLPGVEYRQIDLNGQTFDFSGVGAVVMRHVLEHVHEPARILSAFREAQVQYVFLLVPNAASSVARLFGEHWYYWDPPRHLTFFTPQTLTLLAERCGYREVARGDHGIDEVVTSLYRWQMTQWTRRKKELGQRIAGRPFWYDWLKPKGVPAALSSVASSPILNTVLCRCYELSK